MTRYLFLSLTVAIFLNACGQPRHEELWNEDIDFYQSSLEKYHIDLYHQIDKADFTRQLNLLKSELHEKNDLEVMLELMRITRKIGDGHTAVSLRERKTHFFPLEVFPINGQWRVIKTTQSHKDLLGKELIKVNGVSIKEVANKVSEVAQYVENEQSEVFRTGQYLPIAEVLHGLQLTQDKLKVRFSFMDDSRQESTVVLNAIERDVYYGNSEFVEFDTVVPALQKPKDAKFDFLWFCPIENTQGIYIKFESYPSFDDMEEFGKSVLNFINENQIRQVVIDLRNNGGGDFFVGTFLAYYLNLANSIDWKSGVYVMTDKVTFSAGTSNASQFRQILNAKIVGEPTGSNPTGYQDMGQFTLPNSRLIITYSKRLFRFQGEVTQGVQPDVLIEYDWETYASGKDNMLEWVLEEMRKK